LSSARRRAQNRPSPTKEQPFIMGKQDMVAWMPSDDLKIMQLHNSIGPKWSTIAGHFPGRTVSSIRNRYLRLHAGEKARATGQVTKNRCQLCGVPKRGHICQVKLRSQQQHDEAPEREAFAAATLVAHGATLAPPQKLYAELPVASATVAHQDVAPLSAIPAHLQLPQRYPIKIEHQLQRRQQLAATQQLPTPSPVLRQYPFTVEGAEASSHAPEAEAVLVADLGPPADQFVRACHAEVSAPPEVRREASHSASDLLHDNPYRAEVGMAQFGMVELGAASAGRSGLTVAIPESADCYERDASTCSPAA